MSAFVKLASKLPGDLEINGLDAIASDLVNEPAVIRYAVVWFDCSKVTEDTDTGNHIPTVRVRRFEPVGIADAVRPEIAQVVADVVHERTGRQAMPFAMVEVHEEHDPDQLMLVPDEGEQ